MKYKFSSEDREQIEKIRATMLSLLYDTGARVQELADLKLGDVRLSSPTVNVPIQLQAVVSAKLARIQVFQRLLCRAGSERGGLIQQLNCFDLIPFYKSAVFIANSKIIKTNGTSLLRCSAIPFRCLSNVLLHTGTGQTAITHAYLCIHIPMRRRPPIPINGGLF